MELKLRRGDDHLLGINNEIHALNDHIARCYSENITSQQRMEQLSKAEGHVRRLILDCFKQLNMDLFSKIESIEKKYYSNLWLYWGKNGEFWDTGLSYVWSYLYFECNICLFLDRLLELFQKLRANAN